ncbi:MAG: hypothetical protein A2902_02425 [Elusimicrobia bacterium RIFCSPLOWO2_01_FULL_64_13]|nr:MAG: hypothetical protein A2636_04055 [Elusimicrobia bacterium RIFCSPHIGHO2_01_FULL_64_10]OGR94397.1 MAG: hypothetical protein A2902_02425 [Elusimicrobia bacterium RIFCSPLOWO2_01_FULL_64_13]
MKKIVLVHHSNQLGLGGTEKDMLLFCKYFRRDVFEVHALTRRSPVPPHRVLLDRIGSAFGRGRSVERRVQHEVAKIRVPDFIRLLGEDHVHFYGRRSLPGIMRTLSPVILHVHHSGVSEPPISVPEAVAGVPVIFTINGFGFEDPTPQGRRVTRVLFPSEFIRDKVALWGKGDPRCGLLYCPIEKPCSRDDLRKDLGIPGDVFVVGRVGRNADDIHDPISLRAYKEIESEKTLFLALAPPPKMVEEARAMGLRRVRWLEPTVDEVFLSRFYNTIDALGHARSDGETFGCVIAEAMIHGKPVVTHRSPLRNAQEELVGTTGFVADQHDWRAYGGFLRRLMGDRGLKEKMGREAEARALENFEAEKVTRKLEGLYLEELAKRGIPVPS